MFAELILPIIILIVMAVLGGLAPLVQPKTILFGVRIPQKLLKNRATSQFKRKFIKAYLSIDLVWLIVSGFIIFKAGSELYIYTILVQILIMFGSYAFWNKKVKIWKGKKLQQQPGLASQNTARVIDTQFRKEKLTINNLWYILPGALVVFQLAVNLYYYLTVSEKLAHPEQIISLIISTIFIFVIMLWQNHVIRNAKQQVSARNPQKSRQQNILFRRRWSKFLFIILTLLIGGNLLMNLSYLDIIGLDAEISENVYMIVPLLALIGSVILTIVTGQSGSRIDLDKNEDESEYDDVDDSSHWKLGIFYYNPADPSFFVEKRIGVGWTLNFANPKSYIFILVIIAIVIISSVV